MGPLPASAGCDCHICRPDDSYDTRDRRTVDTILEHGWQVTFVSSDVACTDHDHHEQQAHEHADPTPAFAYTVGLGHRCGHPEMLMSGLDQRVMHRALNDLAGRVMEGRLFGPGDVLEAVLAGVPVLLEEVADEALRETVTCSGWFHRRKPEALMVVWPSTSGLFAWQPGAPEVLDELQPGKWRNPIRHTGGVAPDPAWEFPVPPDRLAFSCKHVMEEGQAILWAARETDEIRGEDWSIHCGAGDHDSDDLRVVHLAHLVRSAPSLRQLADLGLDEAATRADVDTAWETAGMS
jgi:hypothetical protein